jgi:hypothetical protein
MDFVQEHVHLDERFCKCNVHSDIRFFYKIDRDMDMIMNDTNMNVDMNMNI